MDIKNEIKKLLEKGDTFISFIKKDGSKRELVATLDIPLDKQPKGLREDNNHNILRVFDVNLQDWRTVNIDTVQTYSLQQKETV